MPLTFTVEDMKTPEKLERLFQQVRTELSSSSAGTVAAAVQNTPLDLNKLAAQVAPLIRPQLQATGAAPLNTSILLPGTVTSIIAGTGISVSAGTGDITIVNIGVTSITGTANQVIASAPTGAVGLSLPQSIDAAAAVQFGSLNLSNKFVVNSSGLPTKSDNIALAGQGFAMIVASGSALAQSGAVASVAAITTGASGGSFEVGGYINVTAFTAGTISLQCDYTDPSGVAKTLVIPLVSLAGVISTTVGSATDAQAVVVSVQTSGANSLKLYTTVSVFTGTYNVYCWIKQVA